MTLCRRCGAELAPGSLKFLVTLHVTADFDGNLPAEGSFEDLEVCMRRIDGESAENRESDVYQTRGFVLCAPCKEALLRDPLGLAGRGEAPGAGGRVH